MFKKPCAKNRSLNTRVPKTSKNHILYQTVSKTIPKSLILRSHILPRRTLFGSGCLGPCFVDTVLRIRFFGSWLSGYGFLDTVSSAPVFGIRFFGHGWLGGKMWLLHHKIPIRSPRHTVFRIRLSGESGGILWCKIHIVPPQTTVSEKPYPENRSRRNRIQKNHIQKDRTQKTVSAKPYS